LWLLVLLWLLVMMAQVATLGFRPLRRSRGGWSTRFRDDASYAFLAPRSDPRRRALGPRARALCKSLKTPPYLAIRAAAGGGQNR
jgi:hypothetical protein